MKSLALLGALLPLFFPLAARADQSVWLSSLDITKATQGWGQPQADKSVGGNTMTLNGQTFAHGFGTHSPGVLVVALHGGSARFQASVGIDDEVGGGRGNAEFEVLGDRNKILWRSGVVHEGQAPKTVDVDLTGLQQIILRVTTAGGPYDFDHDDWADARFTVTGALPQAVAFTPSNTVPVISFAPPPAAPSIRPPYKVGVYAGTPLFWTPAVMGLRPLTFSVHGLPRGLALNPQTGTITGTLARPGDYAVRVSVKNHAGTDSRVVHVIVGATIALTPPTGWNSYDAFGDDVTEAEILANARYVQKYMQPTGWDTVVVDYRWYDPGASLAPNNTGARAGAALTMDGFGRLLPAPNRFPSAADGHGFRALADEVHAMGLKFGIHIMRGIPRNAVAANLPIEGSPYHAADAANTQDICGWCPDMYGVRGDTPAGQAYYNSLMRLYASWGVDYIKMDDTSSPYHTDEINAVHDAILHCGRSIVYSLSPGETPIEDAAHVSSHANLWRVSGDFWDGWGALNHAFDLDMRWQKWRGPGHWPDSDMLPVGHLSIHNRSVGRDRETNFTKAEQVTLLSLWCLQPAPLMAGANLPDNDSWTLALLTNPEVIAVDQDARAGSARRVSQQDDGEVWVRPLADGSLAVGLFDRGDFDAPVAARWADLGLKGPQTVRDLWRRKTRGVFQDGFVATVPAHGAVLLRLIPIKKVSP